MQRKDNGNWTLKDRSRHNADRQLKEIFKESSTASSSSSPSPSPFADLNGSAGDQTDAGDGDVPVLNGSGRVESGSQTVVVDGSEADMAQMRTEVEMLSQVCLLVVVVCVCVCVGGRGKGGSSSSCVC